jgi:hypothetical protein
VKQNMSVVPREAKQVGHVPGHGPNLCFLNPLWGGGGVGDRESVGGGQIFMTHIFRLP